MSSGENGVRRPLRRLRALPGAAEGSAAAIQAGAQAIITFNLRDFPDDKLAPHNVDAKHPDDFVLDALDLAPGIVTQVLSEQAGALKNPPRTVGELLDTLRGQGLVRSVAKLRELFGATDPIS
jgi:hypothetical protein